MPNYRICSKKGHACRQAGFTLIELLVAISIIATLTAILLPNFMGARERAKDAQKKQDMESVKNALRLFYNDTQSYPSGIPVGSVVTDIGSTIINYLPSVSGIGYTYYYQQLNNGDSFQLCVPLDAAAGSDVADSQMRCAISGSVCGVGVTSVSSENWFVVCGN